MAWVCGRLLFHWMALPAAGSGFHPKTGPLLLNLEGEKSFKCCPSAAPAAIGEQTHLLPTPCWSGIGYFTVAFGYLPFLGWLEKPGFSPAELRLSSLWLMRTKVKGYPKASSFFSPFLKNNPWRLWFNQTFMFLNDSGGLDLFGGCSISFPFAQSCIDICSLNYLV